MISLKKKTKKKHIYNKEIYTKNFKIKRLLEANLKILVEKKLVNIMF